MKTFDVITIGSATQDVFLQGPAFLRGTRSRSPSAITLPIDHKLAVQKPFFATGGGASNAAVTFANFGKHIAYLGSVGDDAAGAAVLADLRRRGVATGFVRKQNGTTTSMSVILSLGPHGHTALVYRNPAEFAPTQYRRLATVRARWLYLTSLGGAITTFASVLRRARDVGMRVACNPGVAELRQPRFRTLLRLIDVLFLNREEANLLLRLKNRALADAALGVHPLHRGITVVTDGIHGAVTVANGRLYRCLPHTKLVVRETTGAGDAFGSGFVSSLLRSDDLVQALQYGIANAEGVLRQIGAKNGLLHRPPTQKQRVAVTVRRVSS